MRRAVLAFAIFTLAACEGEFPVVSGDEPAQLSPSVILFRNALTLTAPEDYCIDPGASRPRRGFVLMTQCDLLTAGNELTSAPLISVQVGDRNTAAIAGAEESFADVLQSEEGRTLMSGSGDATSVTIQNVEADEGRVFVGFEDTSPPLFVGSSPQSWREFRDVAGRLATISAHNPANAPISEAQARRLFEMITFETPGDAG